MSSLPKHIAFIVDGNRRWAKKHGLPVIAGHKHVTNEILDPLIFRCLDLKIPYITFWAFSTENWKRGKHFANALFGLLRGLIKKGITKYDEAGVRINFIGDLTKLPKDITAVLDDWKEKSKKNKKITVTIALNYGGRDEIIRAINKLRKDPVFCKDRVFTLPVTEKGFEKYLDTHDLPDPDLIIRTGGSQRLSGFMLWQSEYSELYFTNVLMPDFTVSEFNKALEEYKNRKRNFGK